MTTSAPPQEDIDHWTKLAQQYDSLPFAVRSLPLTLDSLLVQQLMIRNSPRSTPEVSLV
jgi:hypothetical protein